MSDCVCLYVNLCGVWNGRGYLKNGAIYSKRIKIRAHDRKHFIKFPVAASTTWNLKKLGLMVVYL